MASYKVPQDVEADDKLIGPFSFRQFIYLIVAAIAIVGAWGLAQVFLPLLIIPLPIIVFFGALALPLKKDQPMETYLAAIVSFYLKPRRRLWEPDGINSTIEITVPKVVEMQRTKDLTQSEAERRLSYLADIVDTRGWAVRGVSDPQANSGMQTDAFFAAQEVPDILDNNSGVGQSLTTMIEQSDTRHREEIIQQMRTPRPAPTVQTLPPRPLPDPYQSLTPPQPAADDPRLSYNPYPASIHQSVVNPIDPSRQVTPPVPAHYQPDTYQTAQNAPQTPATTSAEPIRPDIIDLANTTNLSIETIAHEAHRREEKKRELPDEEVVISLR